MAMYEMAFLISAAAAFVGVIIKGVPVIGNEYRRHVDWRDKRTKRQAREISTVSPTTGAVNKRLA